MHTRLKVNTYTCDTATQTLGLSDTDKSLPIHLVIVIVIVC
jgi:hypothetical protein